MRYQLLVACTGDASHQWQSFNDSCPTLLHDVSICHLRGISTEQVLRLPSVTILPEKPPVTPGKCEEIAFLSSSRVPWAIRIISSHLDLLSGIPRFGAVVNRTILGNIMPTLFIAQRALSRHKWPSGDAMISYVALRRRRPPPPGGGNAGVGCWIFGYTHMHKSCMAAFDKIRPLGRSFVIKNHDSSP